MLMEGALGVLNLIKKQDLTLLIPEKKIELFVKL